MTCAYNQHLDAFQDTAAWLAISDGREPIRITVKYSPARVYVYLDADDLPMVRGSAAGDGGADYGYGEITAAWRAAVASLGSGRGGYSVKSDATVLTLTVAAFDPVHAGQDWKHRMIAAGFAVHKVI